MSDKPREFHIQVKNNRVMSGNGLFMDAENLTVREVLPVDQAADEAAAESYANSCPIEQSGLNKWNVKRLAYLAGIKRGRGDAE